jgi:predicted transposase/invertase (TIGR01784 family)
MKREEIEAMFGLSDLKQTRFYQEALEEGREEGERKVKLETVPRLLALGLSAEQIAQGLNLSLEEVTRIVQELRQNSGNS